MCIFTQNSTSHFHLLFKPNRHAVDTVSLVSGHVESLSLVHMPGLEDSQSVSPQMPTTAVSNASSSPTNQFVQIISVRCLPPELSGWRDTAPGIESK